MKWFFDIIRSSIGKKMMMAVTGLGFCGFLTGHLAGNLMIYKGEGAFNAYAEKLHSLGPLLTAVEVGLLFFVVVHVVSGTLLFIGNLYARPERYVKKESAGGRTLGSRTMPYTGFFIFVFVILHLIHFHFADKTTQTIYQIVSDLFNDPVYIAGYVMAMIIVAIHVSHGFWSAFQTLGANHPKYMPIVKAAATCFSLAVGLGFGILPIYIFCIQ